MPRTTLNLTVIQKRMLTKAEAADHCGRSPRHFEHECPVTPIQFGNGDLRWDIKDIDAWIDSLKAPEASFVSDEIIGRL
ncbi:hypothetical protein FHS85_001777 [Rhodoligotrophos appendicifer]|uniref:helix-turn-helix transcriptional regulator n=1 Tax=Rhodoligotrophos appendicifer TaxID=987056 RepID=UPI0011868834|nr:hypothetical protein [Rhodoligotrophos appendicifer]